MVAAFVYLNNVCLFVVDGVEENNIIMKNTLKQQSDEKREFRYK